MASTLGKMITAAKSGKPGKVIEMRETDTIAVSKFPEHVLPAKHLQIVRDLESYMAYPAEFSCVSMIAAAAVAMGRTCEIDTGVWTDGACLYLAIVAPPGTSKSYPLDFALKPAIRRNREYIRKYLEDRDRQASGSFSGNPEDKQFIFGDFTIETLTRALKKNPRGLAVYLDELKAWFQNFNRYNSGSEQEFWLMNFSGKTIPINRSNFKSVLERSDVPVVGTIQPGLLEDIGKNGRAISGFIDRILFCYPDENPLILLKYRKERKKQIEKEIATQYAPLLNAILDREMPRQSEDGEEARHSYLLTDSADDKLTEYINTLKTKADGIDNEYTKSIYSKMQTFAGRLTLILQVMHEAAGQIKDDSFPPAETPDIQIDIVKKAIDLCEYFLANSLKASAKINNSTPLDRLPRDLRAWYADIPTGEEVPIDTILKAANKYNISRATAYLYLNQQDATKKIFIKVRHAIYEKIYHK